MIRILISKEILDHILSLRFSISLILAFLLLTASVFMLVNDSSWSNRLLFTGYKLKEHVYTNGYSWYWVTRDVPALRVLAVGLDENLSLNANSTVADGPRFQNNRNFVHNPNRYLFSQLDFVFFITIIGSLLAFVFTYDSISGEREQGTLRLAMTNPISRPFFLLAKFLGSYLSLLISMLPAFIGVSLILYLHPDAGFLMSDWVTTAFLFLLAILYLSVFVMLGLFVSCIARNSKTTLTALMMLWVILVLVIPNFSPFLASVLSPVRSVYEVQSQIDTLGDDLSQQLFEKLNKFVQDRGGNEKTLSDQDRKIIERMWQEAEFKVMNIQVREGMKIREGFLNEIGSQIRLSRMLSIISPCASFTLLASDIAQTGIESERKFRYAVLRYRYDYIQHVNQYINKTGDYEIFRHIPKATPPDFIFQNVNSSEISSIYLYCFMTLVMYPLLLFLFAQIAFLRTTF